MKIVLPLVLLLFCAAHPALAQPSDEALTPNAKTVPDFTSAPQAIDPPVDHLPTKKPEEEEERPEMGRGSDYITGPYYDMLVRDAITNRSPRFEFGTLRSYYTQTASYDPTGELTLKRLLTLAYMIENDEDPQKRKDAFDEYGQLIAAHLGNIDVMSQALVLSRENKTFGDPKFFEYMQKGLRKSIVESGDGRSLFTAYDVMTMGEETVLMKTLRYRVMKTDSAEEGGVYYNMHQVQSADSVEPYWIFVNVSVPMKYLEQKRKEKGAQFSIPAQ